jgi:hypothetical protein
MEIMLGKKMRMYLLFALAAAGIGLGVPLAKAETVPSDYTPGSGPVGSPAPASGADPQFDFTFVGGVGGNIGGIVSASGILDATSNGDGTFTAITVVGGSGSVVSPDYTGLITLIANPSPPSEVVSPSGFFLYDDQLLPSQNPLITNGGLLFAPSGPAPFSEINIFSNGPFSPSNPNYQYYENNGNYTFGTFTLTAVSAPVPLPRTAGVGFVMLGVFGGLAALRKRRSREPRIA